MTLFAKLVFPTIFGVHLEFLSETQNDLYLVNGEG